MALNGCNWVCLWVCKGFGRCRGGPEWRAGGVERSDHDPEARRAGPVSGGWAGERVAGWWGCFGGKPSW